MAFARHSRTPPKHPHHRSLESGSAINCRANCYRFEIAFNDTFHSCVALLTDTRENPQRVLCCVQRVVQVGEGGGDVPTDALTSKLGILDAFQRKLQRNNYKDRMCRSCVFSGAPRSAKAASPSWLLSFSNTCGFPFFEERTVCRRQMGPHTSPFVVPYLGFSQNTWLVARSLLRSMLCLDMWTLRVTKTNRTTTRRCSLQIARAIGSPLQIWSTIGGHTFG